MEEHYRQILNDKNKDELKVICRKLKLSGFSKLSIGKLKNLILENEDNPKFKKAIGIKPPFLYRRDVILTFTGIFASFLIGYYFLVISQGDSRESIEAINETIEEKFKPVEDLTDSIKSIYKTDLEYSKYIDEQEELNIELLKNFFGEDFQVYGQRNNHLFKNAKELKTTIYERDESITFVFDVLDLNIESKGKNFNFKDVETTISKSKLTKGKLHLFSVFQFNNRKYGMVMLNKDWKNPVYAFGLAYL